jgi:acyl-CoA synthetase (AMP-forming)/AMP-acid ligase II
MTFDAYTGGARKPVITGLTGTGDMGYLDERGCLFIVGREDDMIVSGGENVYPQAVERALAAHPEIADNAVIGVDDAEYGQRLAVFVVVRGNSALSVDDVRNFLKDRVSRFEQPRDVHLVIELPRNPSGKVLRNQLRAT